MLWRLTYDFKVSTKQLGFKNTHSCRSFTHAEHVASQIQSELHFSIYNGKQHLPFRQDNIHMYKAEGDHSWDNQPEVIHLLHNKIVFMMTYISCSYMVQMLVCYAHTTKCGNQTYMLGQDTDAYCDSTIYYICIIATTLVTLYRQFTFLSLYAELQSGSSVSVNAYIETMYWTNWKKQCFLSQELHFVDGLKSR